MTCFYRSSVDEFLAQTDEYVIAHLGIAYANRGFTSQYSDQTLTWERDLKSLRTCLKRCVDKSDSARLWGLLLEFSIPRKEMRIDTVLLIRDSIAIIEAKTGTAASQAKRQIEEYALLLHYFHKESSNRRIVPIAVSTTAVEADISLLNQRELFPQLATYWIARVIRSSWDELFSVLVAAEDPSREQIVLEVWDESSYFPIPSILEAALALKTGLSIREIAHSEASESEIENVRLTVQECLDRARTESRHAICFLTGVPGSGKTLVGLSLAHSDENKGNAIHFMSGNGPLVQVLQHLFTQESMRKGAYAPQARAEAKTLIENVHIFARNYTDDDQGPPSNHAIIFDEAQRAWNRAQNLRKFRRDYSEPEMLLRIMERHEDWAMVIALVGGGQEINDGEAGLEEWGRALLDLSKDWLIYASPEVLEGGQSTAGHRLFSDTLRQKEVQTSSALHLRTSNRSLRADQLATWVNLLLDGKSDEAASLRISERFPMFLARSLDETRLKLQQQGIGIERCGLVGSSGAARYELRGWNPTRRFTRTIHGSTGIWLKNPT
jgi:hypothetical protein